MLSRLQKIALFVTLAFATLWLLFWWPHSRITAFAGFASVVFGYAGFLALEFLLMHAVNRADAAPRATTWQVIVAWWGEVCVGPRVFCWRQPFFPNAVPDEIPTPGTSSARRGVVLVHGFVCNRGFWTPWLIRLRRAGRPFIAVNLEPVFGDIEDYTQILDDAVKRMKVATGLAPMVVCHSMGGIVVRAWLRQGGRHADLAHVVTIGSPHGGTWLGRFGHAPSARQMRLKNPWLAAMEQAEREAPPVRFTCWYSNCDNIVFPASTATLPGADNRLLAGSAHAQMAFHPQVLEHTMRTLDAL